jgi:uncharacterized membrane protein YgcG
MPANSSQTNHTFSRYVAPLAPVALALAMNFVPSNKTPTATQNEPVVIDGVTIEAKECGEDITDFQACHKDYPTGCSKAGGYDPYLNYLKNLTPAAATGINFLDQTAFATLNTNTPSELGKSNNHATYKDQLSQMGEGKQFGLVGYLYYYEHTGSESSNCDLIGPDGQWTNVDFHIGIGFDPKLAGQAANPPKPAAALKALNKELQQNSVIVEMTPHYRAHFHPTAWTLANLAPALGHPVRVIGQLLVDSEHNKPADNCALANKTAKCWRYSIWELHPVTSFEYCADDSCTEASGNWIPIGGNSAAQGGSGSSGGGSQTSGGGSTHRPRNPTRTAEPRSGSAAQP